MYEETRVAPPHGPLVKCKSGKVRQRLTVLGDDVVRPSEGKVCVRINIVTSYPWKPRAIHPLAVFFRELSVLVHDASRLHERSRLITRESWEPEVGPASFQNALYNRTYGRLKVSTDQRCALASTPLFGWGNYSSHSANCATNQGVAL
jgi:hypothetical protein